MDKRQHLIRVKDYLRRLENCRKRLIQENTSRKPELSLVKALTEINYRRGDIDSFDRMMNWISQKKTRAIIELLAPDNDKKSKEKWLEKFDHLVHLGNVLEGKVVTAKQTEMSF